MEYASPKRSWLPFTVTTKRNSRATSAQIEGNLGTKGETFDFTAVRKYRDIPELLERSGYRRCRYLPSDSPALRNRTWLRSRAGKHVLVEKPIALDGKSADELVAESHAAGTILMAAQVLRFLPSYRALAEAMRLAASTGPSGQRSFAAAAPRRPGANGSAMRTRAAAESSTS